VALENYPAIEMNRTRHDAAIEAEGLASTGTSSPAQRPAAELCLDESECPLMHDVRVIFIRILAG
jgi:hypothetical protein